MFLRFSSGLAAILLLLALTASSALRKDLPRPGPLVRLDRLMDQGIPPLNDFREQEKSDPLVKAWLKAGVPPDPQTSVFGYPGFRSRYDEIRLRLEDGGEAEVTVTDLDESPFLSHMISLGAGARDVAGYGLSDQGLLVYDHAGKRWGWIPFPREAWGNYLRDVESNFLSNFLSSREFAVMEGVPDGGDGPDSRIYVGEQSVTCYREPDGPSDGALGRRTPIWPLAMNGDSLLVVPGDYSERSDWLSNRHPVYDGHSPQYISWRPRYPVWIRWREDGPVPGSKRILIWMRGF